MRSLALTNMGAVRTGGGSFMNNVCNKGPYIQYDRMTCTGGSPRVYAQCGIFHASSINALDVENLKSQWEQQKGFCLVRIFHAPSIRELKVTMGAAEGFMPSEGYFMPLQ